MPFSLNSTLIFGLSILKVLMKSRVKLFTIEPSAVGGACRVLTVEGRKENFQPELMKCKELSDKNVSREVSKT